MEISNRSKRYQPIGSTTANRSQSSRFTSKQQKLTLSLTLRANRHFLTFKMQMNWLIWTIRGRIQQRTSLALINQEPKRPQSKRFSALQESRLWLATLTLIKPPRSWISTFKIWFSSTTSLKTNLTRVFLSLKGWPWLKITVHFKTLQPKYLRAKRWLTISSFQAWETLRKEKLQGKLLTTMK